jgi:sucrose-6F-phosphate phosphohydrolase
MFPLYGKADSVCLNKLKNLLGKNPDTLLCYVTGRSLNLALRAVKEHGLPEPDYLITDVGTGIYAKGNGNKWVSDRRWRSFLKSIWHAKTANQVLDHAITIDGIDAQTEEGQSEFKRSFYVSYKNKASALRELHAKLNGSRIPYTLELSKGRKNHLLLDVLPRGASKKRAVKELMKRIGIKAPDTMFAGDSDNDFDLLVSRIKNVVVNNASRELKRKVLRKAQKRATLPTLYFSSGRYGCHTGNDVCGVMEGAMHFGFFSKNRKRGLYVQIHSMHGLINMNYTDIGRDEDTGGQVIYVIELAKALSKLPQIGQVDLMTRRIEDSRYPSYGKRFEYINDKLKIVRLDCGGKGYIKKVRLWPHIKEYVKNVMEYNDNEGGTPDVIHANYADAGLACSELAEKTGSIFVFTAHSLAIPKMQKLGVKKENYAKYDYTFNFSKRVVAEQIAIEKADAVIVSTRDEIENQYAGYRIDKRKFHVIAPGLDTLLFHPPTTPSSRHKDIITAMTDGLDYRRKPMILAASRLERRKNLTKLVEVFCNSHKLRKISNLVVLTRLRSKPDEEERSVYQSMEKIVRDSKCQGSVTFVRFIDPKIGLGPLYRIAARSRGVFINPALIEPFGLTILEASACGLPVVATKYGGPSMIITNNVNGVLIDPKNGKQIEDAIEKVITDKGFWGELSANGLKNAKSFSWDATARNEVDLFMELINKAAEKKLALLFDR